MLRAGLSVGIIYLKVTTDPIELWASPSSRSRVEKDFFDSTFRPFYRAAQVIIHAKEMPEQGIERYLSFSSSIFHFYYDPIDLSHLF